MNRTVVAVFIEGKRLLMEQRGVRKVYSKFLMCPSGHIEEGESLQEALSREMKEELGVSIKKAFHLFTLEDKDPFSKKDFQHHFMHIESFEGEIKSSKEAEKMEWLSYHEIQKKESPPIVQKLIQKLHEKNLL